MLRKFKAKCVKSDPLEWLVVGEVYECEAWNGKTLISNVSGSMVMDSRIFGEHFTPIDIT